jgi:hypothetical protein
MHLAVFVPQQMGLNPGLAIQYSILIEARVQGYERRMLGLVIGLRDVSRRQYTILNFACTWIQLIQKGAIGRLRSGEI